MSKKFHLSEETAGYITAKDETNSDLRLLVGGSKNVLIDQQRKVKSRSGYTRLGAANTALTKIRNAWTWKTSTGTELPMRFYDDELEVFLETVDGISLDAWYRVANGWSTTALLRSCIDKGGNGGYWDSTEAIDFCLMVINDANIYQWNGAVATIASATSNTITKNGTSTWAQNRFYANGNKTVIINGTEYTYSGGESTTTLTGVSPNPTGEAVNSVVLQKIVTNSNKPASGVKNDIIHNFENQIIIGSSTSNIVYGSKNTDFTNYTSSSPRLAGEGFTLTLDNPTRGITSLGSQLLIGSGKSAIFKVLFEQVAVTTTLAETAKIKKLNVGVNQGFLSQESIVALDNMIFYLTNEVAVRSIEDPDNLSGINPKRYSNPIKPDFDAEDWSNAFGSWYKNTLYFAAPANSRLYMLNFVEDEDGKLFRFWNPPQTLPVSALTYITVDAEEKLYMHSNAVPESYLLFDGASDGQYSGMPVEDKLPIEAIARYAYNDYGEKALLKNFDEYFVSGEITPATADEDLELRLRYDFGGSTQTVTKFIDGSDEDILEGNVGYSSLAQQSLAVNPLGGLLNPPSDTKKFTVCYEIAREDFLKLQPEFYSNGVDKYWAITVHGANTQISKRKIINLKK